jgi:hypothetical protein
MEEKETTQKPADSTPAAAPPPIPPSADPPPVAQGAAPEGNQRPEKMSKSDWIMSIATIVIAAGTIVSAVAICLQWREMVSGGADTTAIKNAAQKQADAAQKFADTAVLINGNMNGAVGKLDAQAVSTGKVADQAIVQANANRQLAQNAVDTLANTKQSFKDEQRAWVAFQGTGDNKGFTDTQPWQIQIVFFNSGRTPARNVKTSGMYTTSPIPIAGPSPQQIAMLQFQPVQSIAPQGYYRENMGHAVGPQVINADQSAGQQILISQYAQIKSKQLFLYYYGLLKYDDNSGRHHETQFCVYLADPDTKEVGICDSFNDLD